jgi:hypothetical protein
MTGISAQQSMLVCESAGWRMSMAVEPDSAGVFESNLRREVVR